MSVLIREMLEAGVHFGHQSRSWNPQMAPFIFGSRNKIHIINLEKTKPMFEDALNYISKVAAKKGSVMFVGTKRAARKAIQTEAERVDMPYVNYRWLGGMLTNFKTVKASIKRLKQIDSMQLDGSMQKITKKEVLKISREQQKLQNTLGGIKEMRRLPSVLFIVDVRYEKNALLEARKLGIPVVAIVDTNVNPDLVDYVIPGNDDGIRAIRLYTRLVADAVVAGQDSITVNNTGVAETEETDDSVVSKNPRKKVQESKTVIESKPSVKTETEPTKDAETGSEIEIATEKASETLSEKIKSEEKTSTVTPSKNVNAPKIKTALKKKPIREEE